MAETGYKEIKVAIEKLAKNNMLMGGGKKGRHVHVQSK